MSNTYSDMTGTISIAQVTPVIKAIFGGYNLDPKYPGNGKAYIACMSEVDSSDWEPIRESLVALARSQGITITREGEPDGEPFGDDEDPDMEAVLHSLAPHFGQQDNADLAHFVERTDFDNSAEMSDLFFLASILDDGHGLEAMSVEWSWHCDKPRLHEFGGCGLFVHRLFQLSSDSDTADRTGSAMTKAAIAGDHEKAGEIAASYLTSMLSGLSDSSFRDSVLASAIAQLAKPASAVSNISSS